MSDVKAIQAERSQNFFDVFDNKIPKRVPVNIAFSFEPLAELGGLDLIEAQWNPMLIEQAIEKVVPLIYSDVVPGGTSLRFPSYYQTLKSQSFVMGSNGFFQHPEVIGMLEDEYDYLIEKPLECLYEKIIPRQYKALGLDDPIQMMISFTKAFLGFGADAMTGGGAAAKMIEKYGYFVGPPAGSGGFTEAPYDFLADQLRSFKGVSMDIRRMPEKVYDACEALYPIVFQKGLPSVVSDYGHVFLPLHMPTFMREKDFAKYWWPSFKKLLEEYASMGIHCRIFCEDNWDRYLDYLQELPVNTYIQFEYGDPQLIKDKLGSRHIITGLYPITHLRSRSKQECVDLAKKYIDILAPGGKYIFGLDKSPLGADDVNIENFNAVTETVRDYAVYSNAGETAGLAFNKADYKVPERRQLESRYYKTPAAMLAENSQMTEAGAAKMAGFEDRIFQFLNFLLL
ncbi:MAG: uroporphyrinogen decarboxylase [Eubacteriaceae bacterium]|nr:uroporphyrinogen decarboxylase [Eubacteriaceae bacterium]